MKTPYNNKIYKARALFFCISFCLIFFTSALNASIVINEIVASNEESLLDDQGNTSDWIELYNSSSAPINLKNWYLSDKMNTPLKWQFPEVTIEGRAWLIVFASGEAIANSEALHTNFKLSADGEAVILSDSEGNLVDHFTFNDLKEDQSVGRLADGAEDWGLFLSSTPGFSNLEGILEETSSAALDFSHPGGLYNQPVQLKIETAEPDLEIYYTLDGTIPTLNSEVFNNSISLETAVSNSSDIHLIPTSDVWQVPAGKVKQYHVVRARAFKNGIPVSNTISATYMIEPEPAYSLPVVSIICEEAGLFSTKDGIYIKGQQDNYSQRGIDWERPIHLEYFEKDGNLGIQQNLGLRISGNSSRRYPQKSLKLYARSKYGKSHLDFPFFGTDYDDSFKRLSLRSFNADWGNAGITDDLAHEIIKWEIDAEYAQRKFVIVFLNGVYWGIHSLRETHDDDFLSRKYDIPKDNLNIGRATKYSTDAENGTLDNYFEMVDYAQNNDLRETAHYQHILEQIDLQNLQEIFIAQIFFGNNDWPHRNNQFWQSTEPLSPWRWMFFDLDSAFKTVYSDNLALLFQEYFDRANFPEPEDFQLILALMKNREFAESFRNKMLEMLDYTFEPSRTVAFLDAMKAEIAPEVEEHLRRWNYPGSLALWERDIERIRSFLFNRPVFLMDDLTERIGSPMSVYPNPARDFCKVKLDLVEDQMIRFDLVSTNAQMYSLGKQAGIIGANNFQLQLPLGLPAGFYVLRVESKYQIYTESLVVMP